MRNIFVACFMAAVFMYILERINHLTAMRSARSLLLRVPWMYGTTFSSSIETESTWWQILLLIFLSMSFDDCVSKHLSLPVDPNDSIGWLMLGCHENCVSTDPEKRKTCEFGQTRLMTSST